MSLLERFKRKPKIEPSLEESLGLLVQVAKRTQSAKLLLLLMVILITGWNLVVKDVRSKSAPHIAIINLTGPIEPGSRTGSAKYLIEGLEEAAEEEQAKAIVLMADSPGGYPAESEDINYWIDQYRASAPLPEQLPAHCKPDSRDPECEARKPIVVSITNMCTSACLYIAVAADEIIASPSSMVGSIGVRIDGWDFTDLMDRAGIGRRSIYQGDLKALFDPFLPMTTEQAGIMQTEILEPLYQNFINEVQKDRGDKLSGDPSIMFSGRAFVSSQAMKMGLIDRLSPSTAVLAELRHRHQVDEVIEYNRGSGSLSQLLFAAADHVGRAMGAQLAEQVAAAPPPVQPHF